MLAPLLAAALLVGALAAPFAAQAQESSAETGTVAGAVVDGKTGETLPGANVRVAGTQRGASTGAEGRYRIEGLAPGTYDVEFSFVGYQPKTVTGVEIAAGQTTTLDVTISPAAQELDEVVVTAEVARNSEAGLLQERQGAAAVSNAISAETIGESGASDAAGAMEKVTGASITEGKYVNIRGLGGRYVNTTLNGAELPSADPEQNAVPFDLFPAGLLQSIVTAKTFTPDRSGNFTGGSVDIGTVAFPTDFSLTLSSSAGYNTEVGYGGSRVAFAPGLDAVPGAVAGGLPSRVEGNNSAEAAQRLDNATRAFSGGLAPGGGDVPLAQSYELAFGNEFDVISEWPLGVVASLSYEQNVSGYEGGTTGRYLLNSADDETLSPDLNLEDEATTVEDLYSGLLNFSLRPASGHEVGVNMLYTRSSEQEGRFQQGFASGLSNAMLQTRVLRQTERSVGNVQVRGEHTFGAGVLERLYGEEVGGLQVNWNGAYSRTRQDEPDYRHFANEYDPDAEEGSAYEINVSQYEAPTRYFRTLEEDGQSADASLEVPVVDVLDLKVGGSYARTDRVFDQRRFTYDMNMDYDGNPDAFFGGQTGLTDVDGDGSIGDTELGNIINESTRQADNYDGEQTVTAGFAMIDMQVGALLERLGAGRVPVLSGLRVIGGARVERTDQQVTSGSGGPDDSGRIQQTDWLPSANLVYAVTDEMNVRAAYGRTLARPSFREFAPITFQEFIAAYPEKGNPQLERTLIDNFDVRWEWFPDAGEILALSGFYKNFSNAIERTFVANAANPTITYFNSDEATVYGVELEVRKQLGFLPGALGDLSGGANLTLAHSEVNDERVAQGDDDTRRFQGQSDYLANAHLAYENPDAGTTASLYYNVFGERLNAIVRDAGGPPRFEQPRHTLDFTASQRFVPLGLDRLTVTLKAKNLLGADHEVTRAFGGETFTVRGYELGRTFTLGLEYSL